MQAREAVKKKEYSTALDLYIMLSDMQFTEAEREYAEILERGAFVTRDLDEAMQLFLRAAKKNDARAAYRYSRLAERLNEDVSRFWLFFSAVIGCEQAYPALAKQLSKEGKEELATYYYYLAAVCEDKESIGELAMSALYLDKIEEKLSSFDGGIEGKNLIIYVPRGEISKAVGQKRVNIEKIRQKYCPRRVKVLEKDEILRYNIIIDFSDR